MLTYTFQQLPRDVIIHQVLHQNPSGLGEFSRKFKPKFQNKKYLYAVKILQLQLKYPVLERNNLL